MKKWGKLCFATTLKVETLLLYLFSWKYNRYSVPCVATANCGNLTIQYSYTHLGQCGQICRFDLGILILKMSSRCHFQAGKNVTICKKYCDENTNLLKHWYQWLHFKCLLIINFKTTHRPRGCWLKEVPRNAQNNNIESCPHMSLCYNSENNPHFCNKIISNLFEG